MQACYYAQCEREAAMRYRLLEVLARRKSWLDRLALGLLIFLATLIAALMGGASA